MQYKINNKSYSSINGLVRNLDLDTKMDGVIYVYDEKTGASVTSHALMNVLDKYTDEKVLVAIKNNCKEGVWGDFTEVYYARHSDIERARCIAEFCYGNNIPLEIKLGISIDNQTQDGSVSINLGSNILVL